MIPLFSTEGLKNLSRFICPETLCAFDLDGTLSPIIDDPAAVKVAPDLSLYLRDLSEIAQTAIITGRTLSDTKKRLGFKPRHIIGDHGNEGLSNLEASPDFLRSWIEQIHAHSSSELRSKIMIETKNYSLSIHYRNASNPQECCQELTKLLKRLHPAPRVVGGKCVLNLLIPTAQHKGDALCRLMQHYQYPKALFIGDDETDEDIFRLGLPNLFTIHVGTDRETSADYVLPRQVDIDKLIMSLCQMFRKFKQSQTIQ